jgi:hypothetical protein
LDKYILEDWERYFGPGAENIDEAISRLTGDLTTVVQTVVGELSSIGIFALVDLASQSNDWWELFSLGLNRGYDNQDFFWSDMLHYRKTSRFPAALWEVAKRREESADPRDPASVQESAKWAGRIRAYALGWMTHLGTDTTGHAFVNQKSGGPYRTHWQRHHLIENHMDAETYFDEHGMDGTYRMVTESALHYRVSFKDRGDPSGDDFPTSTDGDPSHNRPSYNASDNSLRGLYTRRRHLDLDSGMAEQLAQAVVDAMDIAYSTSKPPAWQDPAFAWQSSPQIIPGDGRPSPRTVQDAYQILFSYLKMATLDGFRHEKPKPPDVFPNLDFPQLTDPHDDPPNEGDSDMSIWDILMAVIRFLLWIAAIAVWLATVLPAVLADLITYYPRLGAYYCIELPLYYILQAERRVLVMTGYILPMDDEIDRGLTTICVGHRDAFLSVLKDMDDALANIEDAALELLQGRVEQAIKELGMAAQEAVTKVLGDWSSAAVTPSEPSPDSRFPHRHPLDEHRHPWDYPISPPELEPTVAGPFACGDEPHVLLENNSPGSQRIRMEFETAADPGRTREVAADISAAANLGDPINFGAYLIWQLTRDDFPADMDTSRITDWNLDSDRGYGYKCWDWMRYPPPEAGRDHVLRDQDMHDFMEPCTPPPQADPPLINRPDEPLRIHYTDHFDPGCEPVIG